MPKTFEGHSCAYELVQILHELVRISITNHDYWCCKATNLAMNQQSKTPMKSQKQILIVMISVGCVHKNIEIPQKSHEMPWKCHGNPMEITIFSPGEKPRVKIFRDQAAWCPYCQPPGVYQKTGGTGGPRRRPTKLGQIFVGDLCDDGDDDDDDDDDFLS